MPQQVTQAAMAVALGGMDHLRLIHKGQAPTRGLEAQTQVHVFAVHEKRFVKPANRRPSL
jgi:hypothetical protein